MRQDVILIQVFELIKKREIVAAKEFITKHYPRIYKTSKINPLIEETKSLGFNTNALFKTALENEDVIREPRKSFTEKQRDSIFLSDFYQCRYSGIKLFAPPVLTVLALYLEDAFPCFKIPNYPLHSNHQGLWTLYPSPEHIVSLYVGGSNNSENLITASSSLNMVKSQASNYEMGWEIIDKTKLDYTWDGGRNWFIQIMNDENEKQYLIKKAIELKTFHRKISPVKYFDKWIYAFKANGNSTSFGVDTFVKFNFNQFPNETKTQQELANREPFKNEVSGKANIETVIFKYENRAIDRTTNQYIINKLVACDLEVGDKFRYKSKTAIHVYVVYHVDNETIKFYKVNTDGTFIERNPSTDVVNRITTKGNESTHWTQPIVYISGGNKILMENDFVSEQSNKKVLNNSNNNETDNIGATKMVEIEYILKDSNNINTKCFTTIKVLEDNMFFEKLKSKDKKEDYFKRQIELLEGEKKEVMIDLYRHLVLSNFISYNGLKGNNTSTELIREFPDNFTLQEFKRKSGKFNSLGMTLWNIENNNSNDATYIILGSILKGLIDAKYPIPEIDSK